MVSARFTTPPSSFQGNAREPVTPVSGIRNRAGTQQASETTPDGPAGDASPTSSTISNSTRIFEPSRSLYRPFTSTSTSALGTPAHKVTIRADTTIVTCFDTSDKELYNLWAPRS